MRQEIYIRVCTIRADLLGGKRHTAILGFVFPETKQVLHNILYNENPDPEMQLATPKIQFLLLPS